MGCTPFLPPGEYWDGLRYAGISASGLLLATAGPVPGSGGRLNPRGTLNILVFHHAVQGPSDRTQKVDLVDNQRAFHSGLRDPRIDFFRGLALYMIFVDHVIGDPLSRFTYSHFGFSDSAEIFVYLSGLGCGIAYSRKLAREGWYALISVITKRTARIYFYYAVSSGAVILLATAAAVLSQNRLDETLSIAAKDPLTALWAMLCLVSPPPVSGILVLYIVLTLVVVPVFLIAGERYALTTLVTSGLVWVVSQMFSDFTAPLTHRWYLNPLAWQFLFSIGMFFGMKWDSGHPALQSLGQIKWLVSAGWAVVVLAFLYKLLIFLSHHSSLDVSWFQITEPALVHMKENLSAVRLVHFLSVALLVATYFRPTNALLRLPISMSVVWSGMHSLELFSLSAFLGAFGNIAVLTYQPGLPSRIGMDSIAFSLMVLTAFALTRARMRK